MYDFIKYLILLKKINYRNIFDKIFINDKYLEILIGYIFFKVYGNFNIIFIKIK
jgi:hypothetical protein